MQRYVTIIVVAAMILVGGAILVPAVYRSWLISNRVQCMNNLRLLGEAVQGSRNGEKAPFPAGTVSNADLAPEERLSWLAAGRGKSQFAWNAKENREFVTKPILEYLCPGNENRGTPGTPRLTHYIGIAGLGEDAAKLPLEDPRAGFFGYDRHPKVDDIKNGLSNTMMVIETARKNGPWAAGGFPTVRGLNQDDRPYIGMERPFGGTHRNGANVLFGDGAVRFVTERIESGIFEKQATIR